MSTDPFTPDIPRLARYLTDVYARAWAEGPRSPSSGQVVSLDPAWSGVLAGAMDTMIALGFAPDRATIRAMLDASTEAPVRPGEEPEQRAAALAELLTERAGHTRSAAETTRDAARAEVHGVRMGVTRYLDRLRSDTGIDFPGLRDSLTWRDRATAPIQPVKVYASEGGA